MWVHSLPPFSPPQNDAGPWGRGDFAAGKKTSRMAANKQLISPEDALCLKEKPWSRYSATVTPLIGSKKSARSLVTRGQHESRAPRRLLRERQREKKNSEKKSSNFSALSNRLGIFKFFHLCSFN